LLIKIRHAKFSGVELRDGSLVIHSMQGKARVLQDSIVDFAIVVRDELIHIVGFVDQTYAWSFRGTDDFKSERVEFGQLYGGGGQLVSDETGNSHLLYFVKQAVGHGVQLRHQTFSDKWSVPQTVSINVFAERSSYGASWHSDGYLHLVYCGHVDHQLLYRVYDLERRLWSGAVVFSEERCSHPQFIPVAGRLYLFWQEDQKKNVLRVRHKDEDWSTVTQVSSGDGHVSNVGYFFQDGQWIVYWGEESRFCAAPFDRWWEREMINREDFDYAWSVEGQHTIAVYEPKAEILAAIPEPKIPQQVEEKGETTVPVPTPAPAPAPAPAPEPKDKAEEKLQAAFMEQAFRTLQEWEKVREEMGRWQREFKLPEPVDLAPLVSRIERLERRFLSLQQGQEQSKKLWEGNFNQLEQGLARTRVRLDALEDTEKNKSRPLWERLLGRG